VLTTFENPGDLIVNFCMERAHKMEGKKPEQPGETTHQGRGGWSPTQLVSTTNRTCRRPCGCCTRTPVAAECGTRTSARCPPAGGGARPSCTPSRPRARQGEALHYKV